MKAYVVTATTGPDALHLHELPIPTITPDQVLVRVRAVSFNPVDAQFTHGQGIYDRLKNESPLIPGWDMAGEVVQAGEKVTEFKPGDAVFGMVNFPGLGRTYAEYVAAPAKQLARKPVNVSFAEAGAATLAALTAWHALVTLGQVQAGQRVLVHAASGGVGHYAVQIARQKGAHVSATASAENRDFVLSLGAEQVVDYQHERFEDVVAPVDFVFDTVGHDTTTRSLTILKPGGLLVSTHPDLSDDVRAQARQRGVRVETFLVHASGDDMRQLADLLAAGQLRSHLSQTLPFDQLPEALRQLASGSTVGKIAAVV